MSQGEHRRKRRPEAWHRRAAEPWDRASGRTLLVSEIFTSIQGEGSRSGIPTTFLRLTGCALRCRWCDSTFAFSGGRRLTLRGVAREILAGGTRRVCITGGEPLLQPGVIPLAHYLAGERGLDVVVETGGDQDISILPAEASAIMDVKLPGSGMARRQDWNNLRRLRPGDEVKMVVADREDYEEARRIVLEKLAGFSGEILLGAVAGELEPSRLAGWVLEDGLEVRVQLQLHKLLWPGRERGV